MLDQYRRAERLNDFCRILMALQLEPYWQCPGPGTPASGRHREKLSSTLTKADAIDVRAEIAGASPASVPATSPRSSNCSKPPPLRCATPCAGARSRIHRAWQWRQLAPDQQNERLDQYRYRKDIHPTIRQLLRKHTDEQDKVLTIEQLAVRLAGPAKGQISARHAARGRSARTRAHRDP